ncbi:hypothetical protein MMC25_003049 [Agyrium rufum]|nr:hypothetical protein [Agyrium rufum]
MLTLKWNNPSRRRSWYSNSREEHSLSMGSLLSPSAPQLKPVDMRSPQVPRRWLPREGFTADVIQAVVKNTLLNPALTLPLYVVLRYTQRARDLPLDYDNLLARLRSLVYLGLLRSVNRLLNWGVLNNWTRDAWDWEKEIVVVTGGSDGIGKHIVQSLALKGATTVILDIKEPTFEQLSNVHFLRCDISSSEAIEDVSQTIKSDYGPPTILVNNAGMATMTPLIATSATALQTIFAVNTLSHFHLAKAFLPSMIAKNHGMIVTIASLGGSTSSPGIIDYCCTKASALSFHEGLRAELRVIYKAPKVRTLCICPSWARTNLTEGVENASPFLSPLLDVLTVAEETVKAIERGHSGTVYLPKVHEWLGSTVRSWPWWLQDGLRASSLQGVQIMKARGFLENWK